MWNTKKILLSCVLATLGVSPAYANLTQEEVHNGVYLCAAGQSIYFDKNISYEIAGVYVDVSESVEKFEYIRRGAIFDILSNANPEVTLRALEIFSNCIDNYVKSFSPIEIIPSYPEPSKEEILFALTGHIPDKYYNRENNTIKTDFLLSGIRYSMNEFRKESCAVAIGGSGYSCTYSMIPSMNIVSHENSSDGQNHAEAWNRILNYIVPSFRTSETKEFRKGANGWFVI